ncbi:hypothetical protein Tco_1374940 [Tanacetum coccineum]
MSSITAQQTKLDLELIPKEKRLDNNPGKIQREPTFQVVLDALALTPSYSAFLITADVPEVYMHQFWDSVYKHDTFYKFKIDKRKRFKLTLEVFREIFKIYPRVQGQDFDALSSDEEIMSFLRDLAHTREIHSLNDVVVDQMHQPWRTFAALINDSLSGKTTCLDKLRSPEHKSFEVCTIRRMWTMLNYFGKTSSTRLTTKPTKIKRICTTLHSPKLSFITSLLRTRHSLGETRLGCTPPRMTT